MNEYMIRRITGKPGVNTAALDKIYGGKVASWRKLGNNLYLRLLMRVSNKVIEEDGGIIDLGEEYGAFDVRDKIREIYESNESNSGEYPIFQSVADRAGCGADCCAAVPSVQPGSAGGIFLLYHL